MRITRIKWLALLIGLQMAVTGINVRAANGNPNLSLIRKYEKGKAGFAFLNNQDESLMYSEITRISLNNSFAKVTWERNDGEWQYFDNALNARFSPRGDYLSFYRDSQLYVYASSGTFLRRIPIKTVMYDYAWSYDSRYIFISEDKLGEHILYRFDVVMGEKVEILKSEVYFYPVTVLNNNVLYLLRNKTPEDPMWECDIVKLSLESGEIMPLKLPIGDYTLYFSFTISPDETKAILPPDPVEQMFVVDLVENRVIDTFDLEQEGGGDPNYYSWRLDGSYVIVTMHHIYKYAFGK